VSKKLTFVLAQEGKGHCPEKHFNLTHKVSFLIVPNQNSRFLSISIQSAAPVAIGLLVAFPQIAQSLPKLMG
jgi:hypothetical protein